MFTFRFALAVVVMVAGLLLATAVAGAFRVPDKPAPVVQPNYEAMADCIAEYEYVNQYQVTLAQFEKALRLCDTFTREAPR